MVLHGPFPSSAFFTYVVTVAENYPPILEHLDFTALFLIKQYEIGSFVCMVLLFVEIK